QSFYTHAPSGQAPHLVAARPAHARCGTLAGAACAPSGWTPPRRQLQRQQASTLTTERLVMARRSSVRGSPAITRAASKFRLAGVHLSSECSLQRRRPPPGRRPGALVVLAQAVLASRTKNCHGEPWLLPGHRFERPHSLGPAASDVQRKCYCTSNHLRSSWHHAASRERSLAAAQPWLSRVAAAALVVMRISQTVTRAAHDPDEATACRTTTAPPLLRRPRAASTSPALAPLGLLICIPSAVRDQWTAEPAMQRYRDRSHAGVHDPYPDREAADKRLIATQKQDAIDEMRRRWRKSMLICLRDPNPSELSVLSAMPFGHPRLTSAPARHVGAKSCRHLVEASVSRRDFERP
ncbi:uncharacterized protein CC84DRAFT_1236179, partial [Paraphaeosphaeria sporulosa]